MTDLVEIDLLYRAEAYGEIESLLRYFSEHGVSDEATRQFIADLARGRARKPGPKARQNHQRDMQIALLVALEMHVLRAKARDKRKAFSIVAMRLMRTREALSPRRVKQIFNGTDWNRWLTFVTMLDALKEFLDKGGKVETISREWFSV